MSKPLQNLRALVVDDDRISLSVVSSVVRALGVGQTLQASDGQEALDLFQAARPPVDLVVCDWEMPKMNGLDLLKTLRQGGHTTPFLMLTAHNDPESVIEAKQNGVTGYIAKPFTPAQIERKVRAMLEPAKS
ncbi:MAG TPA: response regulator [Candidatus Cybelea sp.]|nr:response regulator [Candidatus Cybelea sp.]